MINLERLETRTVLSDVSVVFPAPSTSSTLLITGDVQNDNFKITENTDGSVTVAPGSPTFKPGVGLIPGSLINGNAAPVNTNNAVSTIIVQLPGTTNFDIVNLTGTGTTTSTVANVSMAAVGANLTLNVNAVHNGGALTVSDIASTPTDGVVNATVQNSSLGSLSINQFGNGPDSSSVLLSSDTIPGPVFVALGNANNDSIRLLNNPVFGPTTLLEGNGGPSIPSGSPAAGTSSGNNDLISVSGPTTTGSTSHYTTLLAQQDVTLAGGTHESISISNIQVAYVAASSPNPPGVTTIQGNGAFDTTTVTGVTTYGLPIPINMPLPPGAGFANISVTQGTGSNGLPANHFGVNDQASVTASNVPGSISITQSDASGNSPSYNTALISNDHAGHAISITQGNAGGVVLKDGTVTTGDQATITASSSGGNASITQGTGINDSAAITVSTIGGSASITQGDQAGNPGDQAKINGDKVTGSDTITQGDGNNDSAQVLGGTADGSVSVTQGAGNSDTAAVSLTSIGGNASISQGAGNSDLATILGPGTSDSAGTIGGNTTITQLGGNGDTAVIAYLTIGQSIGITQGNGNNDSAEIETVLSTGGTDKAPITIGITQGNGNGDIAAIVGLNATGGTAATGIPISITQGSGNGDWAEIANVTAPNGNISITQTDVATNTKGDTALVLNTVVGTTSSSADGTVNDINGLVTITQGSAPGDIALVEGSLNSDGTDVPGIANNIVITQGSNGGVNGALPTFDGSTTASDVAEINDETVTSNITITQGNSNSFGYYVTAIGFDYLGMMTSVPMPTAPPQFTPLVTPSTGSSPVTAGGTTAILQTGANNQVFLGDASSYFYSTFLDVYTGSGGGGFAFVQNTYTLGVAPLGGLFSSTYNISGGGTGNSIYLDPTSAYYVSFDPTTFVSIV